MDLGYKVDVRVSLCDAWFLKKFLFYSPLLEKFTAKNKTWTSSLSFRYCVLQCVCVFVFSQRASIGDIRGFYSRQLGIHLIDWSKVYLLVKHTNSHRDQGPNCGKFWQNWIHGKIQWNIYWKTVIVNNILRQGNNQNCTGFVGKLYYHYNQKIYQNTKTMQNNA